MDVNGYRQLVNNILQNVLFCVQHIKETQTGLEQFEGSVNDNIISILGWTIFKLHNCFKRW